MISNVDGCIYIFIYFDKNGKLIGSEYDKFNINIQKNLIVPNKLYKMYTLFTYDLNDTVNYGMLNICTVPASLSYAKISLFPNKDSITVSTIPLKPGTNILLNCYNYIGNYISKSEKFCKNMINFKQQNRKKNGNLGICLDLKGINTYINSYNKNSNNNYTNTNSTKAYYIIFIIIIVIILLTIVGLYFFGVYHYFN